MDYGDYDDPHSTLHYIGDRFNCPGRLMWLQHGIKNRLFKNLDEYFYKEEKQNSTVKDK